MEKYTVAFLKQTGDYMMVETPLARADLCMVFGNVGQPPAKVTKGQKAHIDRLAEHAADLYHDGYFDLILVTGSVATDDGRPEAHRMRDVLVQRGVPVEKVIVEDKARSTIENVLYAIPLLEKHVGIDKIKSLIAIGHIHASRRFLMTLESHWPEVTKMFTTVNCFDVPKDEWHKHPEFREAVLREATATIPRMLKEGSLREVDMEKFKREIAALKPPVKRPAS